MPTTDVEVREHLLLPETDGDFVRNFQELPQNILLTGSMVPRLQELYPDGQYAIGHDSGIYWWRTKPPLLGCKSPDWYVIPGVSPLLDGEVRRSYVLWEEVVRPLLLIEYVSGDGSEEHDTTPFTGKFWVYEQGIVAPYYAIFDGFRDTLELYKMNGGRYHRVEANAAGRFPVEPLRIELGIWKGRFLNQDLPWLRVWDAVTGQLLPAAEERAEAESKRAEAANKLADQERKEKLVAESLVTEFKQNLKEECERAENERRRADKLAERLRALGVDPDAP